VKYGIFQLPGGFPESLPPQAQLFPAFIPTRAVLGAEEVYVWLHLPLTGVGEFTVTPDFSELNLVFRDGAYSLPSQLDPERRTRRRTDSEPRIGGWPQGHAESTNLLRGHMGE
jgi:hypothetical protein